MCDNNDVDNDGENAADNDVLVSPPVGVKWPRQT